MQRDVENSEFIHGTTSTSGLTRTGHGAKEHAARLAGPGGSGSGEKIDARDIGV